ncbi:hypothetical protein AN640_04585 [Candidatus Epulonipiscium fishelsonii]|uniref:Uncharacterized protein n=1 Tax=Candidatus Epulonipiscium fishelsonii TaxID=77094 RepID=A0ACC8XIJ8_9FIRM|nr:hypothetical protein AN640_04585 [Epulopiscium sp. SCG-D08WGA-EpuloA1]OON97120.1 MAG: hypothetical protein ATN32_05870 [Epulopiscium sp. AS2M-Bin002]
MRIVPVHLLKENVRISSDIYDTSGKVMFYKGYKVTKDAISKLKYFNIKFVLITDEYCNSADFPLAELKSLADAILNLEKFYEITSNNKVDTEIFSDAYFSVYDLVEELMIAKNKLKINYLPDNLIGNTIASNSIYTAIMSTILGLKLGYGLEEAVELFLAAYMRNVTLHSRKIKNKKLLHPITAYEFLSKNYMLSSNILLGILHHHEAIDGSGYPQKLQGDQISEYAKIIHVIKMFYALRSAPGMAIRNYIDLNNFLLNASTKFDLDIIEAFVENTLYFAEDTLLRLSTGEIACVIDDGNSYIFPTLKIVKSNGMYYKEGEILNMEHMPGVNIVSFMYYVE